MNFENKKAAFDGKIKDRLPRLTYTELSRAALTALTAFFMGICPLPFSVYPLGIAFFCASSSTALFAAAGLLAASFFTPLSPSVYLLSSILALLLRLITRTLIDAPKASQDKPLSKKALWFHEALPLRAASASVAVFALSLYSVITGGFRYYDLFGAIFSVLTASAATVIFYAAFSQTDGNQKSVNISTLRKKTATLAIAASLCLSLNSIPLKGVSLGLAAAFIFTNHFCLTYGLVEACISSLLCGAVCGVENIPVLIVAAFTAYCVLDASPTLAAAVSCIAGAVCGVMLKGSEYMADPFLSLLLGLSVYATIKKLITAKKTSASARSAPLDLVSSAKLKRLEDSVSSAKKALAESRAPSLPPHIAGRILDLAVKEAEDESTENLPLAKAISRRLYELGFGYVTVSVTGKRSPEIYLLGERLFGSAERADFIRRRLTEATAFPLTKPKITDCGGSSALVLRREPLISCSHSVATSPREQVCGDSALTFCDNERNLFYSLICDGMGSGERAQRVSALVSEGLRLLLLCGFSPKEAISIICEELAERPEETDEITTTVDLLVLDLCTGKGALYKSGAAPSYLVRGSDIVRLSARTIPVGIMKKSDVKKIDLELASGDLFLMVSDGISECEGDSLPLLERLNSIGNATPNELTADIIELSRKNRREDDLSAIAVKIFPYNY